MQVTSSLSLTGVFNRDPRPSSKAALEALENGVPNGLESLPNAPQMLEAAAQADGLCDVSRQVLDAFSSSRELPVAAVSSLLQKAGLEKVASGRVSVDYEHHFDMHYAPGGGFRGSNSYNSAGETSLASVDAYQQPGSKAGLVNLRYNRPGHVGPRIDGTILDGMSGANSLFFVPDLSQVQGLEGHTIEGDGPTKQRLEQLFTSLDTASPVQLHNYQTGYGRVGTSFHDGVRVGGKEVSENLAVAGGAASLHGMRQLLGVSGALVPAPQVSEAPSTRGRLIGSLALGAGAAGVGTLLGNLHPAVGVALAGVSIAAAGFMGQRSHREDARDFPLPDAGALQQRNEARAMRGLQNGLLLGTAVSGAAWAGAALGWPGVALAAGACLGAEALLTFAAKD